MALLPLLTLYTLQAVPVAGADDTLQDRFKLMGQMTKFGLYGLGLVLLAMAPLRQQKRAYLSSFYMLWSFVQYSRWLPTIDIGYPEYYRDFYEYVAQTMCVMRLDTPKGVEIEQKTFGNYCADQNLFVVNGVEMLLVLLIAIALLITALVLGVETEEGFRFTFKSQAKYSALFRGISLTTFDLMIYAVLQFQFVDFNDNFQRFSTVLAVLYLTVIAVYTVVLPLVIVKNREKIRQGDPPSLCSTLTDEFRPNLPHLAYHYETLLHLHRLCSSLTLVVLYNYPKAQLGLLCALEGVVLGWMVWARPYEGVAMLGISVLMHLMVAGQMAVQWLVLLGGFSDVVISLTAVFIFWAGVLLAVARYFLNFKLPAQSSSTIHTEAANDLADNSSTSILTSLPNVKSQLPNAPYRPSRVPTAFLPVN